jgi:hypothetical protein
LKTELYLLLSGVIEIESEKGAGATIYVGVLAPFTSEEDQ